MELLAVVKPPIIYYGCFTQKMLWKEKFTPVNMKSCGRHNVMKHKEIKNSGQYIALEISLEIDGLEKNEFTSSGSRNYLGRSGKGMTTYLTLGRRRRLKKKRKARNSNTEFVPQYLMNILEEFKDITSPRYSKRQVKTILLKLIYY